MPARIWADEGWEVDDDGLVVGTVDYFKMRHRLCQLRPKGESIAPIN
jgi:hypothetical protein